MLTTRRDFVPVGFAPPLRLEVGDLRLEPLAPEHNERDHAAWTSSIDHIRRTPGFEPAGSDPWPTPMTLRENLSDLEMHARHFRNRDGFTYTVLYKDNDVVGCVYIYPGQEARTARVRSWVRTTHATLDTAVRDAVADWLAGPDWPFGAVEYAGT
ncbi:MAG: N-acetyltransferase [Actinobacteria bacterium]|nr:N-acetyltransferase [Actinomycetota bacterium]